jgi:hypothetical protein
MSKNPFDIQSLAPTWATADLAKSAVLKGGPGSGAQAGHTFEGNQYVSAGNQLLEANKLNDHVQAGGNIDHFAVASQHQRIARALEETAKSLEGEKGVKRLHDALSKAGQAHRDAAAAHLTDFQFGHIVDNTKDSARLTQKAADASLKADKLNYGY